jgi:hypothetical protein
LWAELERELLLGLFLELDLLLGAVPTSYLCVHSYEQLSRRYLQLPGLLNAVDVLPPGGLARFDDSHESRKAVATSCWVPGKWDGR